MKLREKIFILFIALVYLMGQWGCATGRYEYPKPEPLLEKYREQLGTIGVVKEAGVPVIQIDKPLPTLQAGVLERTGRGTWEGAKKSSQWWVDHVCGERTPASVLPFFQLPGAIAALALCIPIIPLAIFGGLGGAIGGLASDEPPETFYTKYVEENEAYLRETLAEYPIQEYFQSAFLKEARVRTSHTFLVVPEEGSQVFEGMVGQGVDTVLELSAEKIWLKRLDDGEGEWNPLMVLVLVVRARLVQATEKTEWYDQTFVHETEKRPYEWWVHPIRFQGAIEKAYQELAEQMVHKLFLHQTANHPAKIDTSAFFSETTLISQK